VLPESLAPEVESAAASAYITPALVSQATVYAFLRREKLAASLERVCGLLRERRDAMMGALERHLPEARWTVPEGGYFLWLELPDGVRAADLRPEGVTFVPGTDFFPGGAERAPSGSRSATSRRQRSKKACGASPQPSVPRCSSAERPSTRRRRYS
jgi:2-aminoadipate transaminase